MDQTRPRSTGVNGLTKKINSHYIPEWTYAGAVEPNLQVDARMERPSLHREPGQTLARVAGALFAFGLFLPAVNMDPWLPGFNLFVLSFLGTVFFWFSRISGAANIGPQSRAVDFLTCVLGGSANVLMGVTFFRINRFRRSSPAIAVLTVALTLAAGGALCYRSGRSVDENLSFGYFARVGCAALSMIASGKHLTDRCKRRGQP